MPNRLILFWIFFVIALIFSYFKYDLGSAEKHSKNIFNEYVTAIEKDNNSLKALAEELVIGCETDACKAVKIYSFVQQKLTYLSDPANFELIQKPEETLAVMAGDCEDFAILISSLLWNLGIKTQLVATETHMYSRLCGVNSEEVQLIVDKDFPSNQVLVDVRKLIPAGKTWKAEIEKGYTNYKISFNSDEPISFYVFPDDNEVQKMEKGENFRYNTLCSKESSLAGFFFCDGEYMPSVGFKAEKTSVVDIKITATKPWVLNFEQEGDTLCLPLDAAVRGGNLPPAVNDVSKDLKYIVEI